MFKKFSVVELDPTRKSDTMQTLKDAETVFDEFRFRPCAPTETSSLGFVKSFNDQYVGTFNNNLVVKLASQGKTVNKYEIAALVEVNSAKWLEDHPQSLDNEGQPFIPRDVLESIKDAAKTDVTARTYPKEPKAHYIVFRPDGKILVDGAGKAAEDLMAMVRKVVGSLPVYPVETKDDAGDVLRLWFIEDKDEAKAMEKFTFGHKVTVVNPEGIEYKTKGELYEAETAQELAKEPFATVTSLELEYDGLMDVTITDKLTFEGIKVDRSITENEETDAAALIIITNEINKMVDTFFNRLGKPEKE